MEYVKDLAWKPGMTVPDLMDQLGSVGFQSVELARAKDVIVRMKKEGAKIVLTFTSNMVTSGLRGFFAQLIQLGMVDIVCTTVGGIEEDIMRAKGEQFPIATYQSDDISLHEQGMNRIGNLLISNESYVRFESIMAPLLAELYTKKNRYPVSEFLAEIGRTLQDDHSFLCQAAKRHIPVFCPAITDGAMGFQMFMFQQKHNDFIIDVVKDFANLVSATYHDEKKGIIALGGGLAKHHAIFGTLINGGCDYSVYMTTARVESGSMSGATTQEAKSWGKIKDQADAATVIGDVTILFPLAMIAALEELHRDGIITP